MSSTRPAQLVYLLRVAEQPDYGSGALLGGSGYSERLEAVIVMLSSMKRSEAYAWLLALAS
jgi:hypothetical protein